MLTHTAPFPAGETAANHTPNPTSPNPNFSHHHPHTNKANGYLPTPNRRQPHQPLLPRAVFAKPGMSIRPPSALRGMDIGRREASLSITITLSFHPHLLCVPSSTLVLLLIKRRSLQIRYVFVSPH